MLKLAIGCEIFNLVLSLSVSSRLQTENDVTVLQSRQKPTMQWESRWQDIE